MNHHHRISDEARAEREARVLAVVLGMASTDETAAVEQLLRDDPELRAYRDELIETLPTLQEALKASADSPDLRMDEARRAVLLRKLSGMEIKPWVETMPGDGNRMSKSALKEASTNIVPWPVFFRKNIGTIAACAACAVVGVFVAGPAFWPAPEITVLKSRIPEEAVTFTFGSGGGQGSLTPPENGMHYDRYSSTLGEARISDIAQSGKPSSSADASSLGMTSSGIGVGRGGGRSSGDFSEKQGKAQDGAPFSVEGGVIDSLTPNMRARSVPATSAPQPPRPTAPSAIVARKPSGDSGVSFADKQRESVEAERDSELSAKKKSFSTSGYSGTTKPATGKIVAEPNSSVSSGTDLSHEAASMRRAAQIVRRDSANGRSINAGTKLESTVAFSAPAQSPAVAYRGASVERQDVSKEAVMASGEKMVDLKITSAPRNLAGTIGAAALVSDESVTEYFHRNPLRADVGDLEPLAKDEKREADFDLSGNLVKDKGSIDYGTMPRSTASGQTINGGMISGAGEISKMGEGRLLFADSSFEGKPVSEKDTTTPVDSGTRYLSVTSGKLDQLSIVGDVVEEGRLSTKGRREGIKTESSLSGKGVPSVGGKAGGNGKMSGSDGFSPIGGSFSKERSSPESLKEDIWDHDPVVESDPVSGRLRAVIPAVTFRDAPLSRVVETLSELSKMYDPEQKGVNMVLIDPEHLNPNISVTMRNVSIDRLLEYVTKSVSFDYMIKNGVIEICPAVEVKPETEIFPIPTTTVVKVTGDPANHSGQSNPFGGGGGHESMEEHVIRQFLQRSGVPFDTVAGSALSYDGTNLIVTQSRQNLDTIRRILAASYEEENPSKAAEVPAFKLVDTLASENAFSTFSLNVSDVSFRLAAEALNQNRWPDKTSLRTEEFVNAVKYNDPPPAQNEAVALTQEQVRHPFAHNRDLLRLSVQTASAGRNFRQPLNLTVLLDTSGSMTRADRQEIVEVALQALADNLHPNDTVSVIGFSRHPRLLVDRVNGSMGAAQLRTLAGRIPPEGGTNLETALLAAYEKSRSVQTPGVQSTIVLLTDGAANLGDASPETLAHIISQNKKLGIGLNCYGIGFDGYNDAMLETLARTGNGRYAYLNNADEARNDFAAKLAGALQVAAQNVKVQVEFNPARVGAYRLMGYEKHRLKKEEFRDNSVAAAELGAAESGTAVYSIEVKPDGVGDVGVVRVRYQEPTTGDYKEREWNIPYSPAVPAFKDAAPGIQLAATAALLAEKLEGTEQSQAISLQTLGKYLKETDNALSVFPENRKLQSMVEAAIRLE